MSQDIRPLEDKLNQMILDGKLMESFDEFYADDVVMQENNDEPRKGKPACRQFEVDYLGAVSDFHGAQLHATAVDGDRSYSEWTFDMTFKNGKRARNTQVAARVWKDGKVVHERFFYQPNYVE